MPMRLRARPVWSPTSRLEDVFFIAQWDKVGGRRSRAENLHVEWVRGVVELLVSIRPDADDPAYVEVEIHNIYAVGAQKTAFLPDVYQQLTAARAAATKQLLRMLSSEAVWRSMFA